MKFLGYTHTLARFVCALSRWMTHLGWATVKSIVKADLASRYGSVSIKEVKRIAIDEIYVGKKAKFLTLVIDLDTGHILHVAKGRGKEALIKFWRRVRKAKARIEAAACDMSARVLHPQTIQPPRILPPPLRGIVQH